MSKKAKNLLKKIFPLPLLRQAQLRVNNLRIKTIDKLLFEEEVFVQEDFIIQRNEYPFHLYPVNCSHLHPLLREQFMVKNADWTQDEYLLIYDKPCIIEPSHGWALSTTNKLIYPSLGFSRVSYLSKPNSKVKKLRNSTLEEYPELISLRDTGEENYYHFYNDVLAKLFFLEEKLGLAPTVPVLVSRKLYEKEFFKYFLNNTYLSQRHWVVQDEQCIRSLRTYFCKPLTHTPHYYPRILELVRPEDRLISSSPEYKVFVTRNPKRLRFIENNSAVEAVCKEFGFITVDFDDLSLPEQIRLLGKTRYLVAIHGAGLTNMLFRNGAPLGVLEIFPPAEYFPFHYAIMANQLKYQYDGIVGEPGTQPFSGGFKVDLVELRQHLSALLES
jgi:hypothetical protein